MHNGFSSRPQRCSHPPNAFFIDLILIEVIVIKHIKHRLPRRNRSGVNWLQVTDMAQIPKSGEYLSTGQAARHCSVTSDAVLKWIKQRLLPACRTAGGHYRIHKDDIERFVMQQRPRARTARPFQYCWEYHTHGEILQECKDCIVYRTRAQRCYEVIKLAPEIGHQKLFCKQSCEECDYYQRTRRQQTNVLVVSNNLVLTAALQRDVAKVPLNLAFSDCEYDCSAKIDTFRPDYAIIDCSLGPERSTDIVHHLKQDPRIPYVRVILAARAGEIPKDCDREVFARITNSFNIYDLANCIGGLTDGPFGDAGMKS